MRRVRPAMALVPLALAAAITAAGGGCSATTGVDLAVLGADQIGGDQIVVAGGVEGETTHMATAPSPARSLQAEEDLRIVLPDDFADRVVSLHVQVLKAGSVAAEQDGAALLVRNRTKRVRLCFAPGGACP